MEESLVGRLGNPETAETETETVDPLKLRLVLALFAL